MRATGPTNTAPRVIAGRTMLSKPVGVQIGPSRPWKGSRPAPPTYWISSRPTQNTGTDTPITDSAMMTRSISVPRRRAASVPSAMPSGTAQIRQASISSTVGQKVSADLLDTGAVGDHRAAEIELQHAAEIDARTAATAARRGPSAGGSPRLSGLGRGRAGDDRLPDRWARPAAAGSRSAARPTRPAVKSSIGGRYAAPCLRDSPLRG